MKSTMISNLLEKTSIIKSNYEFFMDEDGSGFNIFSILNLKSKEVRLHSKFLAELLNSKGSHTFKNIFCTLFLRQLRGVDTKNIVNRFNTDNYTVEFEKYVGTLDETGQFGGRIDLVLTDNKGIRILIENKIFAADQNNQLLRYYNYDINALLIYLTLNGNEASNSSTNKQLSPNEHYFCISYKYFIDKWLQSCIEESKSKPRVSETIKQYKNIIEQLTESNLEKAKMEKIINIICTSKDFFLAVDDLNKAYNFLRQRIIHKFMEAIIDEIPDDSFSISDNSKICYIVDNDNAGLYLGFYLNSNGFRVQGNDPKYTSLVSILKEINPKFNNNHNFLGWIFFSKFNNIEDLPNEDIFNLQDEAIMKNWVAEIKTEFLSYVMEFKNRSKNLKIEVNRSTEEIF